MAETELERAERRFAQAKARLQGLRNREVTRQRKLDTRRKVILGGALVDLAARDDAAAAMLERLVRAFLFNAQAHDARAYAGVALLLLAAGLLAALIPARRAARVDPLVALRVE